MPGHEAVGEQERPADGKDGEGSASGEDNGGDDHDDGDNCDDDFPGVGVVDRFPPVVGADPCVFGLFDLGDNDASTVFVVLPSVGVS